LLELGTSRFGTVRAIARNLQRAKLSRQVKAAERFLVPQYEEAALTCLLNPQQQNDANNLSAQPPTAEESAKAKASATLIPSTPADKIPPA
jgi:hypothetical protein